jgi:hypothetical protein
MVFPVIVIVVIVIICVVVSVSYDTESFAPLKYKMCSGLEPSGVEKNVMNDFNRVDSSDWDIWLPCGYTDVERELNDNNNFQHRDKGWILGFKGTDKLAAKDFLWSVMKKYHGENVTNFLPKSWVTVDHHDMRDFERHCEESPNKLYIMKKNIQQQKGINVFQDFNESRNAATRGYVIIQEVLMDPYLVDDRKTNFRIYMSIVCVGDVKTLHVFEDGFVYYTPKRMSEKTDDIKDKIVTTGYIDRSVYESNPLTLSDFRRHLDLKHGPGSGKHFDDLVDSPMRALIHAYRADGGICKSRNKAVYTQIFGVDMQMNSSGSDMKIIEINKGPDLGAKDDRDRQLKHRMVSEHFSLIGVSPTVANHGWREVN